MKTIVTTVRLPEKIVKMLDQRAKEERLDRTAVLRAFLEEGIMQWKKEEAVKRYKEGRVSLSEAAQRTGFSVGEMMEELARSGVPSDLTREEYQESLRTAFTLFAKSRKGAGR